MRAAVLFVALIVACSAEPPPHGGEPADVGRSDTAAEPAPATWQDTARATRWLTFDPARIRVGDTIGGLVLTDADVKWHEELRVYHGVVKFRGEVELAGYTRTHPDVDIETVCFEADTATGKNLPRFPDDLRRPWFCFSNDDDAAARLGPRGSARPARIVIDDFVNVKGFSDETNSARLVRVIASAMDRD